MLVQALGDDVEELHELREHERLLARIMSAFDELDNGIELGRLPFVVFEEKGGVATELA